MKFTTVLKKSLLLTALLSSNTFAEQYTISENQNIQYFGYVGYSYLASPNDVSNTFAQADSGMPETGLNVIYNNDKFQIFNQFRFGETSGTYLVYNFMQYTFNIAEDVDLTLKGGKLRHDFGLYNTTRVNPRTRQGILMPQAIYWDVFDELLTSGVGVGATLKYKDLELSYTIDDPTIVDNKKTARVFVSGLLNKTNTSFGSHQLISATYSPASQPLIVKASWMHVDLGNDTSKLLDVVIPRLKNQNIYGETLTFGAEYTWRKLILSGETLWFRSQDKPWSHISDLNKGYSLTATYQVTDNIDVRVNYNEYVSQTGAKTNKAAPTWMAYYKDLNAGINYHVDNWMFQVEGHHINGSRTIDSLEVKTDPSRFKDWWMVGMSVVYSF